ncbi:acetate--CoA ligase family protein [Chloroflexota bacterium]
MNPIEYPDLEPLFRPRSIAIIGASDDVTKISGVPLKYALDHGYWGKMFPVNPRREIVQGLKAYPSVADIPEDVDACVIVIAAAAVPKAFQECADKGVKAAVICVSGFAEFNDAGKKLQDEIEAISRQSGLRICGPNTPGLLNVHEGVSLGISYSQEAVIPGRLAYVSQSGALQSATVPRFTRRGIGMSYLVGAGNQADLELFDYARYVLDDPNTDAVAVYLEGFKNPLKFLDVAELALKKEKPMTILKIGRSELSARTARSHTASLVGSDAVFDAICKQKGIARATDFNTLVAISSVLLKCKPPRGNRVGVISTSGGAISLIADHAIEFDLSFPDLSVKTKKAAAKVIPGYGEMTNPFDIASAGGSALQNIELTRAAVQFMMNDENIDSLVAFVHPAARREVKNIIQVLVEASQTSDKPIILFNPVGKLREGEEEEAELLAGSTIPMVNDGLECASALNALVRFGQTLRRYKAAGEETAPVIDVDIESLKKSLRSGNKTLTEHEGKQLLARYGIPVTEEAVAKSPEEATRIAARIGYPVVLKVDSPDIIHKTEAGAIKLNIGNEDELFDAYNEVMANARRYKPEAEINGILVQEMVQGGREVLVGISHDPQFGPVITFGLGGVFVEALKDVSLRLAPITGYDAGQMVREIKGRKILEAFRGQPGADIEGIVDTLLRLSRLAVDLKDAVSEIDINPLLVFNKGQGVKAIDALVAL